VEQVLTLLVNHEKLKDPTDVANTFNNFFIIFTEKLNIQQRERRCYLNSKISISWEIPQHQNNPNH